MNERVQLILKTKNISASKFADEIGVQRSSISHIISGRNNPSLDFIQKILTRFPDINSNWLIFGKGGMYKEQDLFSSFDTDKREKKDMNDQIKQSDSDVLINKYDNEPENESVIDDTPAIGEENKFQEPAKRNKNISVKIDESAKSATSLKSQLKKIERIIIFYTDKSCTEYKPE